MAKDEEKDKKGEEQQLDQQQQAGGEAEPEPKGSAPAKDEATKQAEAQAEYDKARQQLDQERANARRARAALEEAQAGREELAGQLTQMQGQVAQLQSQLKEQLTQKQYADLAKLDPETTDVPELVKAFQVTVGEIQQLRQEKDEIKQFVESLRAREQEYQKLTAHQRLEEEIYSACDKEFGPQYRNEAVKASNDWAGEHADELPSNQLGGFLLMRRFYAEAKQRHEAKPKARNTVPTDTGLRGLSGPDLTDSEEFKAGSLDEVKADMLKTIKAGKWRRAFASPP